jgi:membrane associated rhomboid family serine protease
VHDSDSSSQTTIGPDEPPLADTRERAEAWALVLTSQGLRSRIEQTETGYSLVVASEDVERADRILAQWVDENLAQPSPPEARLPESMRPGHIALAYSLALFLLVFHFALEHQGDSAFGRRIGSANAYYILRGELWRLFTALTLHKDLAHALGNTLIGGLFLASLAGRVGVGVALAGALLSGAVGNLADAIHHQTGHNSIGASTAVFGVVGLLCGIEAWRRRRLALPWRGAWVPIGAGAGLLAMLGSGGGEVDFGAHVYGLLAGMGIGFLVAPRVSPEPPNLRVQIQLGFASVAVLAGAWVWGLRVAAAG